MNDANVELPNILYESEYVLNNINITESDVADLLDISKAIGPDGISPVFLRKERQFQYIPYVRYLIFPYEAMSFLPIRRKLTLVQFKRKKTGCYKIIVRLISIVGKVMERCVFKHINNYLLDHNIITHCQSGFTKGDSAINQLHGGYY